MQVVIEQAGREKDYMEVAALVKQKRDSAYVRNRLRTRHPARQWLPVWDREGGEIDGSLRKKVTEWLHIPHRGEVKTSLAAKARYYWPAMYNEVLQKVKDCEA